MTEHLGENAELYPLGILDDDAAREVERHIAFCSECADRVARAEAVAASLAAALPVATPSPTLERRLRESARLQPGVRKTRANVLRFAIAAAFVIAFLGLGLQTLLLHQRLAAEDVALVTMVHSHFNHVSMSPESASPVAAKILYARDGSWIYIIADKPGGALHAIAHTERGVAALGAMLNVGETATLLVHPSERVRSIVLQRGGATVASAKLVY
jgi:anti-sigma factor RsiW